MCLSQVWVCTTDAVTIVLGGKGVLSSVCHPLQRHKSEGSQLQFDTSFTTHFPPRTLSFRSLASPTTTLSNEDPFRARSRLEAHS